MGGIAPISGTAAAKVVMWAPGFRPKTGFQLWLEENRTSITAGHPDLEETDVIKEAMGRFRMLSAEDRLVPHSFTSFWLKNNYRILQTISRFFFLSFFLKFGQVELILRGDL